MKSISKFAIGAAMSALLVAVGCSKPAPVAPKPDAGAAGHGAADHAHGAGPHGGTLADWGGGKYHVEFTVDHDKQEATVYILGSDEKTATAIKAKNSEVLLSIKDPPIQAALKASPQAGDSAGAASRFAGNHTNLGKVQEYAGTISAEVDGTPYAGDFKEESAK